MLHHQFIGLINSVYPWQGSATSSQKLPTEIKSTVRVLLGSLMAGLVTTQVLAFSNLAAVNPDAIAETPAETTAEITTPSNIESNFASIKAETSVGASSQTLADGIYLYGQSPELNQVGQTYMVFESRGGKMIGAFYMPQSEFDCFYGTRQGNELALTVVNSYDRMTHTFALGIVQNYPVASASDRPTHGQFSLEGFHPIANLSELDQNLLATCKQNYQEEIW